MYSKIYLALIIFFVFSLGFPLFIFIQSNPIGMEADIKFLLSYLIIFYSSIKLTSLSLKNERKIMELTFWIFSYIWLGLSSFASIIVKKFPWEGTYSDREYIISLLIILCGFIFYDLGIIFGRSRHKSKKDTGVNIDTTKTYLNGNILFLYTMFSFAIAIFVLTKIGFSSLFIARLQLDALYYSMFDKTSVLIFSNLLKVPLFVLLVICIVILKNRGKIGFNKISLLTLILFFANLLISNPISNPRYWFGTVAISVLFLILKWNKHSFAIWTISLATLLLLIFPYADLFRAETQGISLETNSLSYSLTQDGDYDAFQQILNTVKYIEISESTTHGYQLLGSLLFWVPRSLWAGKPVGSGQFIAEQLGYSFTNLSCPLWAESYINFGWMGVVLIFFIYGYLTEFLQKKYISSFNTNISIYQLIVPFLAAYQLFFLRGDLLNGISYMSCFLLFTFLYFRSKQIFKLRSYEVSKSGSMYSKT
jgi:oligosaccharide repeat unit polymerase